MIRTVALNKAFCVFIAGISNGIQVGDGNPSNPASSRTAFRTSDRSDFRRRSWLALTTNQLVTLACSNDLNVANSFQLEKFFVGGH